DPEHVLPDGHRRALAERRRSAADVGVSGVNWRVENQRGPARRTTKSTRRLRARPEVEALSATGSWAPQPAARRVAGSRREEDSGLVIQRTVSWARSRDS